ncbi:hypothetical protein PHMEG_00033907 [Phytophthora megakarya]|uniref:Uncharacterized protein n=1 Tax=Phytophthora megakarya TaxID=4795 RepID=A0A225UUN3_9STRA|nr:hypothetical protein PHMEG_00033907 [Phytophthora megakarya]
MWPLTITACVCIGYGEGVISRLNAGDSIDQRRMIYTAYFNQCEMIELLLDKGADLESVDKNGLSALRTAIHYRKEEAAMVRMPTRLLTSR